MTTREIEQRLAQLMAKRERTQADEQEIARLRAALRAPAHENAERRR